MTVAAFIANSREEISKLKEAKNAWEFDYDILENQYLTGSHDRAELMIEVSEEDLAYIRKQCKCQYFCKYPRFIDGNYIEVKKYYVFRPKAPSNRINYTRMNDGIKGASVPCVRLAGVKGKYF